MKIAIASFLIFVCSCVFAQVDSLSVENFKIRQVIWDKFAENPSVFQQLNFANFTETNLYARLKNQSISKVQTPNKVEYYGFRSNGFYSFKNIKVFGNLDFYRSYAKESSYLLFHNLSEEFSSNLLQNPTYPIAQRIGNSENQHYKVMGGFSGFLLKKMPFSVKLNYNVEKFFGLNIPKTEQEVLEYSGIFQFGYQLKDNTFYGILELGRNQNNFTYNAPSTNNPQIDSVTAPLTYAGFSVGYGDVLGFNATLLEGLTENDTFLFGGGYNFTKGAHLFDVNYTYKDKKEKYFSTYYIDNDNLAAVFNVEELTLNLNYLQQTNKQLLSINAKGILAEGVNTHVFEDYFENDTNRIAKQNYKQELQQLNLSSSFLKLKENKIVVGLNYYSTLQNTEIIDLNTTTKNLAYWFNQLSLQKDFIINDNCFFNVETGFSYYFTLQNSLDYTFTNSTTSTGNSVVPLANSIGDDLILADYIYDSTKKVGQFLELNYQLKLKKGQIATFSTKYSYLQPVNSTVFNGDNTNFSFNFNIQY